MEGQRQDLGGAFAGQAAGLTWLELNMKRRVLVKDWVSWWVRGPM